MQLRSVQTFRPLSTLEHTPTVDTSTADLAPPAVLGRMNHMYMVSCVLLCSSEGSLGRFVGVQVVPGLSSSTGVGDSNEEAGNVSHFVRRHPVSYITLER